MFNEEAPELHPFNQWLKVVGRLLILAGMVIFFASVSSLLGFYLCNTLFGVDISTAFSTVVQNPQPHVINAMKLFQVLAGSLGMFLIPALVFIKSLGYKFNEYIPLKTPVYWPFWLLGIALLFISNPLNAWLYQINQYLSFPAGWEDFESSLKLMEENASKLIKVMVAADSMPGLMVNIAVVALMPAICEELFFRGVLQQYLKQVTENAAIAIGLSAIIFSAFHGQFYGFLPRVMLGVVLGLLYQNTGNLLVPFLVHFVNNALAVVIIYLYKDSPGASWLDENYQFSWYWVAISAVATIGILLSMRPLFIHFARLRKVNK